MRCRRGPPARGFSPGIRGWEGPQPRLFFVVRRARGVI